MRADLHTLMFWVGALPAVWTGPRTYRDALLSTSAAVLVWIERDVLANRTVRIGRA